MRGFGRARRAEDTREITDEMELLTQRIRVDVFCSNDHIEAVIETIRSAAHTGLHGDGKIYVVPVEDALDLPALTGPGLELVYAASWFMGNSFPGTMISGASIL